MKRAGLTYKEIGKSLGISRQRAHQLIKPSDLELKKIIESRNGICDRCKKKAHLTLHHVDYNEDFDYEVLCRACHIHADYEVGVRKKAIPNPKKITNKDNTSGYRGVVYHKHSGLWHAVLRFDRKQISLGYYPDRIDAAKAYDSAAVKFLGELAVTNFGPRRFRIRNR